MALLQHRRMTSRTLAADAQSIILLIISQCFYAARELPHLWFPRDPVKERASLAAERGRGGTEGARAVAQQCWQTDYNKVPVITKADMTITDIIGMENLLPRPRWA